MVSSKSFTFFVILLLLRPNLLTAAKEPPTIKGFDVSNYIPGGGLKNASDWDLAFRTIKALPGKFNAARIYSSTDGGLDAAPLHQYLPDVLPVAVKHDMQLLLGLWIGDERRFAQELKALIYGFRQFENAPSLPKIVTGISVGSEDLYRNETDAAGLVGYISQVRQMLANLSFGLGGCDNIPMITHADTWEEWINAENAALVDAVDFITVNAFPFWENGTTIENANETFWSAISQVKDVAAKAKNGKIEVWLGETGWATNFNFNTSVGSVANSQTYWNEVVCGKRAGSPKLFGKMNGFYYADRDYWDPRSFGILDKGNKPVINLTCPP